MNKKLLNLISQNKLFENFDLAELDTSKINGELLTFPEGVLIYSEGSEASNLFLVMEGKVNIVKTASLGNPESINFTKDDFFGIEEVIENIPRISTAVAVTDVYLISFGLQEIRFLIRQSETIKNNILRYANIKSIEQIDEFLARQEFAEELEEKQIKDSGGDENKEHSEKESPLDLIEGEKITEESYKPSEAGENISENFTDVEKGKSNEKKTEIEDSSLTEKENIDKSKSDIEKEIIRDFDLNTAELEAELWNDADEQKSDSALDTLPMPVSPFTGEGELIEQETPEIEEQKQNIEVELKESKEAEEEKIQPAQNIPETEIEQEPRVEQTTELQFELPEEIFESLNKIFSAENISNLKQVFSSIITDILKAQTSYFFEPDESGLLYCEVDVEDEKIKLQENKQSPIFESLVNNEVKLLPGAETTDFINKSELSRIKTEVSNLVIIPLRDNKIKYGVLLLDFPDAGVSPGILLKQIELYRNAFINHAVNLRMLQSQILELKLKLTENLQTFLKENLKNRMLVIKNFAKTIKEKEEAEEKNKFADFILDETNFLLRNFKEIDLLSVENKTIKKVQLKLTKFLTDFIKNNEEYFKEKYCNVFPEFNYDGYVAIDTVLFENALTKIINNACEAMPYGGNLKIVSDYNNGYAILSFIDKGIGIDENDLPFIYEPFTSFNKPKHPGLGLTIAKKIIELHNGKIEILPCKEGGTKVAIWLPALEF